MVTHPVGGDATDLGRDRPLLRTIVRELDQNVGVYATVARGGSIREGAEVLVA
jgi:hypothetical protein